MNSFYSQHGEDFLINEIFNGKTNGYYVEIGCLDGIEYSNTYFFEQMGWKGMCLEAHNDFIPLLMKNRPGSTIVHCAVGEDDKENVTFYANKIGSLSTLDKSEEERWKKHYSGFFHGFEEQKVHMRTLTSVFNEYNIGDIDFISLDIEGYEVNALKGLDLSKFRPRLFIIEYKDESHKSEIEKILFNYKYYYLGLIGCNMFFSTEVSDKKIINRGYGNVDLILVSQDGTRVNRTVNLSKPSIGEKIKHKISKLFSK